MLFDPAWRSDRLSPAPGSLLRRWVKRLCLLVFVTVSLGAALLLFAPLL